jgi:DNA-binding transcriptional LysR family regulator
MTEAVMEFRILRYFLTVADSGSVTEGARAMHLSQPSMSRQMRALERELGVDLFSRGHGPLALTHAGVRFASVARDLLRREHNARMSLRFDTPGAQPILRIVAPYSTIMWNIAPFIAEEGRDMPIVDVTESVPDAVFELAESIGADLGISSFPPPPNWRSHVLHRIGGITAQFQISHELQQYEQVSLKELSKHQLIVLPPTHAARRVLDESLARAQVSTKKPIEIGSPVMAQALAAAGHGVAVMSTGPMFGLRTRPIVYEDQLVDRHLYAGWKADHYASTAIENFCRALEEWGSALSLDGPGRWMV